MRTLSLLPIIALVACGGDEPPPDPGTGTGTSTGTGGTTAGGPTGASTGSTTNAPEVDHCLATVSEDWDDDGTVDRVRFERWSTDAMFQTSRVEHFSEDADSAIVRRDFWDWDANGNNIEYARDDYNDGSLDQWVVSTFDGDDLPVVVWARTDGEDRETSYTNADGRAERADLDLGADGTVDLYTLYSYDADSRLISTVSYDEYDMAGATTTLQYFLSAPSMDRSVRIDLTGDGNTDIVRNEVYAASGDLAELMVDLGNDGTNETHQTWTRDLDGFWTETVDRSFLAGNLLSTTTRTRSRDTDGFITEWYESVVTVGDKTPDTLTRETYIWECHYY